MNLEQHKTKIIQKVKNIQDDNLLDQMDTVLNGDYVVAYTIDDEPLTKNQYVSHIESICESIAKGAKNFTTEEVKKQIFSIK
ncbi:hypothetical protein [Flavobacterium sp.]|jgi:hypothetical protein|uniref:hypothetical protein n=1 Tax=Flavobacterium sp. TaxID=239 RepID=UPI0037BFA716